MNRTLSPALAASLANGHLPVDGILTAGQPRADQFASLAAEGIGTVLDIRAPGEPRGFDEPAAVRAAGMEYHNIPVVAGSLTSAEFDQVRELLRAPDKRPVLFHCASANRVGALLMPYLVLDEQRSEDEALQIALDVGLRSDELAHAALDYIRGKPNGGATR
ncbi:MAG TPA: protein tyrosine phosphatase family protein [Gemmatimonadaceae bacterium]|nr:protein tyrosine phosphatase family protein [Gemmatimonadaceae bacterium]